MFWLFGHVGKPLDKKAKVNLKFYVTDWQTNNYNTIIVSMEFGQLIEYNLTNIFLQKSCRKWGMENSSRPFCFLKKLYIKSNQVVSTLGLIYFGRLPLVHTIKTNYIAFSTVDPEII